GSGTPPTIPIDVLDAMHSASREVIQLVKLADELRDLVKDVYGDSYDAVATSTAEAALWVSYEALFTPPIQGRGSTYSSAYIAPYERHLHHQGGYGRPFPPKYKDLFSDRGVTSGDLGIQGKRLANLETLVVPLEGARYEVHGIKYHTIPMLTTVDPDKSIERMKNVADRHIGKLAGFASLGYDTVGYGYGDKDSEGVPKLQKYIGKAAQEYDVPFVCDNARGLPFGGTDPRKTMADVMFYSMDKAAGGPTCGFMLGKEDVMVPIRKAMGVHGTRQGTASSFGKAGYVMVDPGKEALAGLVVALRKLRDDPNRFRKNIETLHKIVTDAFSKSDVLSQDGVRVTKSYNGVAVEVNYVDTWKDDSRGLPIFSIEDMYAGTNFIQYGLAQAGIRPPLSYDGNIYIVFGQSNLDDNDEIMVDRYELAIKGLVSTLEIISKWGKME
ncbi:MAG: hypothetical protein RTV31_16390, partial [Candidatus Thorarchaeota archaeon]